MSQAPRTRRHRRHSSARQSPGASTLSPSSGLRTSSERSYSAHRAWLLNTYGPICAYCGVRTGPEAITLDHVHPRRGKSAYDRPDNLVLACRACNSAKADTPLLAWLMAKRSRGVFLRHYGWHLSGPLLEQARMASENPIRPAD